MVAIFFDMLEKSIEVFMDDFSVIGPSFDECLENMRLVLKKMHGNQSCAQLG